MTLHVEGLRWHDPISVVGAPSRSECYGVVAPPRSWGRGIRNAAHCTPSIAFPSHMTRLNLSFFGYSIDDRIQDV